MHLPSVFLAIPTPALRLWAWLLLGALCLSQAPAEAGEVHAFNGNKVKGCQLDGNAYTCGNLPSTAWDDSMAIANGYSVHIKSSVSPGWDYGVSMSGSARLTSGGSINLNGINPAKISISGGSFDAAGEFTLTRPIRVTANVTAGSMTLGGEAGFQITGNMVSKGALSVATSAIVNGSVSGVQVTVGSSVKISGSLNATGAVSIGSSSSIGAGVTGASITADSSVTVTGNLASPGAVSIGSSSIVTGAVSGSEVTTNSSVKIGGSLTSAGRVTIGSSSSVGSDVTGTAITLDASVTITGAVKASDVLTVGSHSSIRGPISGTTSITLNSPSTIVGTVTSKGPITIGSHANIDGAISGTVVTTSSPVTLKGNIVATSRFTLASGSTVNGDITSPEIDMYAASSVVTGKVTAAKYLTMGHAVRIKGDVDTGQLKLEASDAIVNGNAAVDFATLYWHGRVSEKIFCKKGTRPGYCDCVDNQSDYPVNTANGPRCESPKPVGGTFSHFLIEHDGNDVATCSTKDVKVSACANDDCSQKLATSTRVIMQPGGASANFIGSGTVQVSSARKGVNKLSLTLDGGATQFRCRNTKNSSNNSSSCDVNFTGDVGFQIKVPNHKAGNWVTAELQALKSNGAECKPAFINVTKPVQYTCSHGEPTSGTMPVMLARTLGTNPANPVELMCSATKLVLWDTAFDGNAKAQIGLTYTDAGKVTLSAKTDEISGAHTFTAAPDHFDIVTPSPLRAGLDFDVKLTARNAGGATTPNFNKAGYPTTANATRTTVSMPCTKGALAPVMTEFTDGKATVAANYSEAGSINLRADLQDFLGTELDTVSTTGKNEPEPCTTSTVGPFVPMYFQVELNDTARIVQQDGKDLTFYYSREPIPLKITAMNAKGQPTTNYPAVYGSDHAFTLSAVDTEGTPFTDDFGTLAGTLAASDFVAGIATWTSSTKSPQATFQFGNARTTPTPIRLRVANKAATGILPAGHDITSAGEKAHEKAQPEIRSGRLRIATLFGRAGSTLDLPVTAEYWSGKSWLFNNRDDFTIVPAAAIAQTSHAHANGNGAKPKTQVLSDLKLEGGKAKLPVQGDTAGWIDIAFNLGAGAGTGQDQSCLKSHPQTSFANLHWLQSLSGCTDPSGRATFGIFAPESRRIIHMREVFN
ncbi:DUF6701 domain-containing protein [Massilia sp. CFBP9026]|uniref:DUF6701 domain-containing protein n=1 Tax=Massilia sp. CFBP9026 TaxID=3096536 RepID=UPI002A6AFE43|nr:DUF6701 domain-containing protein [Massilia sp. CFBP9026]MDY0965229.1 DUF6701 domain-containing protein [Massilia sp. CFBP9026]